MKRGFMYMVAIIDWYSRYIVGFELSNTLDKTFVIEAIQKAIKRYGKPEIMNSDQGSQFTSDDYINLLKITVSKYLWMERKSIRQPKDRTIFRSYKWEKLYLEECETVQQLRQITKEYVEHYNHRRPHQSLDYKHRQSITLEDMTSYWQLYRIMGLRPKPRPHRKAAGLS